MSANPQMQAYALWMKDRGLAYPVVQRVVAEATTDEPDAAEPVVSEPVVAETAAPTAETGLAALRAAAATCTACGLAARRVRPIFGYGSERARVVFIGDGAFPEAAQAGEPFFGDERELLDKMIAAMQLGADGFYVTNALLCPVPTDRVPDAAAFKSCQRHLAQLLALIEPQVVVAMGQIAARAALGPQTSFHAVRGQFVEAPALGGIAVLTTYHPRDLLRHPGNKRLAWSDLKAVMERLS